MKKILISIRPKWVEKILNGEKKIEIRKSFPKWCGSDYAVYIYATKPVGKIVAQFKLKQLMSFRVGDREDFNSEYIKMLETKTCLTWEEIQKYAGDRTILYGWFIEDLEIFDKPKELVGKAPQSWKYYE